MGIYHRNGAPIDRALLQSLVDFLSYRGPDSQTCWLEGSIGLGHAMLRTTHEAQAENQPASLKGRLWIAADARIDCREDLTTELRRTGSKVEANAPDSALILHAYAAWGTPCVEHLMGDFSFAIWDAAKRELFCARDHFGIKPFYYVQRGDLFLFSNTLNCVRMHPEVSGDLNDAAIGDFLLFGLNYDNSTTSFRDIQRLPPAHYLTFSANGSRIRRYWKPPTDGRIRYAKPEEYVENFQSLLQAAVADRLRTDRVGILLSGGLDSSSVAVVAKAAHPNGVHPAAIRGYTCVYDSLIPDSERDFASEVGEFLHIPVTHVVMDNIELFEGCDEPEFSFPEPMDNPLYAGFLKSFRFVSADFRVLLSGEGGDNLMLFQMWPYIKDLHRNGEWRRLVTEGTNFLWVRPFPWRGIRGRFLKLVGRDPDARMFPGWLAPDFARRGNLRERWKERNEHPALPLEHPIHAKAHASLFLPQWTLMFEQDAGVTNNLMETRYPFLDLRIVNYLLALPMFPWCFQKMLLREAMVGRLPERVRARPKTPLQGDPVSAQLQRTGARRLSQVSWCPVADRYIKRSSLFQPHGNMKPEQVSRDLRPYCLNIWLQSVRRVRYDMRAEAGNG